MPDRTIDSRLVRIALQHVGGNEFEAFFAEFFPSIIGTEFVPLGGHHDGGADAFQDVGLFEGRRAGTFFQASVEADIEGKIRATVKRLREFGREPTSLTYVTSRTVRHIDEVEDRMTSALDVEIRIRDGEYIANTANKTPQTRGAVERHLRHHTRYLQRPGGAPVISASPHVSSPAVYVFLRQEVERRGGDTRLADAVVDTLILWALEGTDPVTNKLMSRSEARDKILAEIPAAKQLVEELLDARIESLASKGNTSGREVRWHQKEDSFCLPYETRQVVESENSDDELVKIRALESIRGRIMDDTGERLTPDELDLCVAVADRAVQIAFEREGLEFSYFLENAHGDGEYPTISDHIAASLDEARVDPKRRLDYGAAVFRAVRAAMYYSQPEERDYFGRLSRTYGLLFTLNCEPRLIEYFQEMAADFYLYVGSDVLVRALSERNLPREDQMTRNMLAMARAAGARLVLAAPVLDEVVAHLRSTDIEFRNWFSAVEPHVTLDLARNAPKILLRSYFYARLEPALHDQVPGSWDGYINQFCDYADLHRARGGESVRRYLQAQFGMEFATIEEVRGLADAAEVQQLAVSLEEIKSSRNLASNDALMTLAVYGLRARQREGSDVSEFGYRTWWLTDEARILRYTKDLVREHAGVRYMMRPDFLLNFLALAPSVADVRRAYANVFPTLLGVRLARRMDDGAFHQIMQKVRGWDEWEDGRRAAAVAELSDRLKGDFDRQYLTRLDRSQP